jgi:hypothetical protein
LNRGDILSKAGALIDGDRKETYGSSLVNHERIAAGWRVILDKQDITPGQVATCMAWLKIARLVESPAHEDSWVDLAGYAALAGEMETSTPPK